MKKNKQISMVLYPDAGDMLTELVQLTNKSKSRILAEAAERGMYQMLREKRLEKEVESHEQNEPESSLADFTKLFENISHQ